MLTSINPESVPLNKRRFVESQFSNDISERLWMYAMQCPVSWIFPSNRPISSFALAYCYSLIMGVGIDRTVAWKFSIQILFIFIAVVPRWWKWYLARFYIRASTFKTFVSRTVPSFIPVEFSTSHAQLHFIAHILPSERVIIKIFLSGMMSVLDFRHFVQ